MIHRKKEREDQTEINNLECLPCALVIWCSVTPL